MSTIVETLSPIVIAHWPLLLAAWAHLFVGSVLAGWTVWDLRRRNNRRRIRWALAVQFLPPTFILYLLSRTEIRPFSTPFGEVRGVSQSGKLLPKTRDRSELRYPKLFALTFLLGGIFPGLGQLVIGRPLRTLFIWCLLAFSGTLALAHVADANKAWIVPDRFLPEAQKGSDVSVNFHVPGYLFVAMCVELSLLSLFAYADTVYVGDQKAAERAQHPDSVRQHTTT